MMVNSYLNYILDKASIQVGDLLLHLGRSDKKFDSKAGFA